MARQGDEFFYLAQSCQLVRFFTNLTSRYRYIFFSTAHFYLRLLSLFLQSCINLNTAANIYISIVHLGQVLLQNSTMRVFKVLSLNVRGLRDNVKRRAPLKIDSWLDVTAFPSFQMKILQQAVQQYLKSSLFNETFFYTDTFFCAHNIKTFFSCFGCCCCCWFFGLFLSHYVL